MEDCSGGLATRRLELPLVERSRNLIYTNYNRYCERLGTDHWVVFECLRHQANPEVLEGLGTDHGVVFECLRHQANPEVLEGLGTDHWVVCECFSIQPPDGRSLEVTLLRPLPMVGHSK